MQGVKLRGRPGKVEAAAFQRGLTVDQLTVVAANSQLPYFELSACQADSTGSDTLPQNSLAFFNSNCPNGWSPWGPGIGRFLVPAVDSINRPVVGDPLPVGLSVAPQHSHPSGQATMVATGIDIQRSQGGTLAFMTNDPPPSIAPPYPSATAAPSEVPFVWANICQKTAAPGDPNRNLPTEMQIFNTATTCPEGWSPRTTSPYAGRYLVGSTPGNWGRDFGGPPLTVDANGNGEVRRHLHAVKGTVILPSTTIKSATQQGNNEALPGEAPVFGFVAADLAEPNSPTNSAANVPYAMATYYSFGG